MKAQAPSLQADYRQLAPPTTMNELRLQRFREMLSTQGYEAFLVTQPENRRYLSGFTGSAGTLLLTAAEAYLLTDFRYVEQSRAQAPLFDIRQYQTMTDTLAELVDLLGIRQIAFEADHVTHSDAQELAEKVPVDWVSTTGLVSKLRWVKDEREIEHIAKAAAIADEALAEIMPMIKAGVTEREIALELEFAMKRRGSEGFAFNSIIASGPNGALPHAVPTDRRLVDGDFLVMDFGAVWQGYRSDMTRTLVIGTPTEKHREIYEITLEAQLAGLAAVAPGKTGAEVDQVSRDVITRAGYGDMFGHGLGHGVGLAIHEGPTLSKRGQDPLAPGMVVTVEPGIYLPGWGGVRIEDLVVVTEDGCRILSSTTKEMITC